MAEKEVEAMNSLDTKCNDLKHAYDSCFNSWFAESFLRRGGGGGDRVGPGSRGGGDATNSTSKDTLPPPTPCDAMLKAYSDCVKDAMKEQNMDPKLFAKYWEEVRFMGDDNDKFPKGSANQDSN